MSNMRLSNHMVIKQRERHVSRADRIGRPETAMRRRSVSQKMLAIDAALCRTFPLTTWVLRFRIVVQRKKPRVLWKEREAQVASLAEVSHSLTISQENSLLTSIKKLSTWRSKLRCTEYVKVNKTMRGRSLYSPTSCNSIPRQSNITIAPVTKKIISTTSRNSKNLMLRSGN